MPAHFIKLWGAVFFFCRGQLTCKYTCLWDVGGNMSIQGKLSSTKKMCKLHTVSIRCRDGTWTSGSVRHWVALTFWIPSPTYYWATWRPCILLQVDSINTLPPPVQCHESWVQNISCAQQMFRFQGSDLGQHLFHFHFNGYVPGLISVYVW